MVKLIVQVLDDVLRLNRENCLPVSWHPMQLASYKRFPSALSPGNAAALALGISRINSDAHKIILFMVCLRRLVRCGQTARCFYYFFMIVVVISYKTKSTAHRALTFIVRIFVNDTIAIPVWTSFHFHVCVLEVDIAR